jgi:hypothetical protein
MAHFLPAGYDHQDLTKWWHTQALAHNQSCKAFAETLYKTWTDWKLGNLADPLKLKKVIFSIANRLPQEIKQQVIGSSSSSWDAFMDMIQNYEIMHKNQSAFQALAQTLPPANFTRHTNTRPQKYFCTLHKDNPTHNSERCRTLKIMADNARTGNIQNVKINQTSQEEQDHALAPETDPVPMDTQESDEEFQADDAQVNFLSRNKKNVICHYCDGKGHFKLTCGWKKPCSICYGPHYTTKCHFNEQSDTYNTEAALRHRDAETLAVVKARNLARYEALKAKNAVAGS